MKTDSPAPADVRINGIVHDALRRDLTRTMTALGSPQPPNDARRVAIADHLVWMTGFLHMHHGAEDELWPLIRQRNQDAGVLLDRMAADHARISPAIDRVAAAATNYRVNASPEALEALASSVVALEVELLPHLRREEDEMMPIVARSLTRAEWEEWDRATNIAPKSRHELALEGHWLIDNVNQERYDVVVHLVPAALRFVLLHAYARPYRRACATRWGPDVDVAPHTKRRRATAARRAGRSFRTEGAVSLHIDAAPRVLYDIIADVTRTGERSPECHTCTWLPGPPPGTVGARFRGHNKARHLRWSRGCEVVAAVPGAEFAFRTVPERVDPTRRDSTTWSYTLTPERRGTLVTHSYRITALPARPLLWLYCRIMPQHTDMRPQMLQNLEALRREAALGFVGGGSSGHRGRVTVSPRPHRFST
ncbi:hemerythrin domain-containing protein [Rhodococcus jostii]|uniref:Polyketide cyclase / dehydrase and lipid transport n=1 Tax=Rhodococcus jostii TaxID=132919 RepID=A0A1H4ZVK5_RHOJO|nr:hemerythrin domain-containing protein [Rhodococcus jostii]SED33511.1 Polyketide cyclase / dehydrase and lipid transport [Rhodococcus jostii]